jgi:ankyrin repeat protein
MKMLLVAGADPNAKDALGRSAFACICASGCTDAATFALGFGAGD